MIGRTRDRVDLGVGTVDAAQEWTNVTSERAVVGFRRADADVASHVDRAVSTCGNVKYVDAVGVGDGVDTGSGHIDPNADSAKTDLVAFFHLFRGEGGFDGTDKSQVDAPGCIHD
ncbi:hypothetical protein D3C76_1172970 [compost metagenome]